MKRRRSRRRRKNPGLDLYLIGGIALAVGGFILWKKHADEQATVNAAASAITPSAPDATSVGAQAAQNAILGSAASSLGLAPTTPAAVGNAVRNLFGG